MANFLVLVNAWYSKTLRTGGEYHMLRVLKRWSLQHKISLILPKIGYEASKQMLPNVKLFYFSSTENDKKEINSLLKLMFSYFIRVVRSIFISPKDKPDIIITASHLLYDIIPAIILCRKYNSKLVVYNHGVWGPYRSYKEGLRSNLMLLNEKLSIYLCNRSADVIFVINSEIRDFLIHKGYDANKITIMRNGIEHELIELVKGGPKKYEACFCARLVKRKGVYDLLDVWSEIIKYFPESKLVIVGEGEEHNGLCRTIVKKGLEKNISLTGYVPDKEKISIFKSSKVFVYPSYEESWGITVTEAMACGLPVISYNLSAYNFLRSGIIKLDTGNKKLMETTIKDLLSNDNQREELGRRAREESKRLDWEDISEEELKVVTKLLDS
ncbi:MAG TPA: glycosyltransferase family 4 protein [Nitrososphaeraceae archaeon]|nr:glycosyltransferase family 4 protein [Nitrososphaeraceae archaeon]